MTSVIIDCDPGLDDAIAILLAIKHLNVVGITTVSGNESIEKVTTNALKVLELGGATHIPVVRGSDRPLKRDPVYAPHFHGESGMGGADLPAPTTVPLEGHAVEFIIEVGMSASDLVLISIGPLTNIATALRKEPRLRERVKLISMMGGSVTNGNVTPAAEFNVYHDAEAADIVFRAKIPIFMAGLNLTGQVLVGQKEIGVIRTINNGAAQVVADLLNFYVTASERLGARGASLHDPCAVMAVIEPDMIEFESMHVVVETSGDHTYGMTVCDRRAGALGRRKDERSNSVWDEIDDQLSRPKQANVEVGVSIDRERFFFFLVETLQRY